MAPYRILPLHFPPNVDGANSYLYKTIRRYGNVLSESPYILNTMYCLQYTDCVSKIIVFQLTILSTTRSEGASRSDQSGTTHSSTALGFIAFEYVRFVKV